eukprot:6939138-Prymnesium_polylepis.1
MPPPCARSNVERFAGTLITLWLCDVTNASPPSTRLLRVGCLKHLELPVALLLSPSDGRRALRSCSRAGRRRAQSGRRVRDVVAVAP